MVRGCQFFGLSLSYTVFNLPLSILFLPVVLLDPVPFTPFSPIRLPADNPPCDPHFYDSVPVLVVCLVCFCFLIQLLIVVSLLLF